MQPVSVRSLTLPFVWRARRVSRFTVLAVAAVASTLILIAVGGLVRATGSGLGCPDWPGCTTAWGVHAFIESSHRATAGLVLLLILTMALVAMAERRRDRVTVWASIAAAALVLAQAGLGALVVLLELPARLVTLHLGLALAILALVTLVAARELRREAASRTSARSRADDADVARPAAARAAVALSIVAAALVLIQMLLGSWVTGRGAGLAFADFPLMDGRLVPPLEAEREILHFAHRALAVVVAAAVLAAAVVTRRGTRDAVPRQLAAAAVALIAVQVLVGGANVWSRLAPLFVVAHLVLGALLWSVLVALVATIVGVRPARVVRGAPAATQDDGTATRSEPRYRAAARIVGAYVRLTKPRIIQLLLVTTVPAMVLAAEGMPSPWLLLATLIGGTLAAGSANAINCYVDRGIDELMRRTRGRPLPRREIAPAAALRFGIGLGAVSVAWLWVAVNPISAALGLAAILFYVLVYTLLLKRRTPHNIVLGGAAGCVPVLVGWAAVTGRVELPALVLFAIVFYWTPPHFWALALRYRSDYEAASVPMLPVVSGAAETSRQILLYSILLVAVSLLLLPVGRMGAIYLAACLVLGGAFLLHALALRREPARGALAIRLFRYSITYLALLFGAIALDSLVRVPLP